jgi:hypothetical protein
MAAPVEQAGVRIPCPRCGNEVMQKAMIPVGEVATETGKVTQLVCVACARKLILPHS